jgi:hypothetical protein
VERLTGWIDWCRFARERLEYDHDKAVVSANRRSVEDLNRQALREHQAKLRSALISVLVVVAAAQAAALSGDLIARVT